MSINQDATIGQGEQQPVAWFKKASSFGPWVECGPAVDGAIRLYAEPIAQAAPSQPEQSGMPPFAEKILRKLGRFEECATDFDSGGVDIGRPWLDMLTQLGLLIRAQRSPAMWEMSQQGQDALEAYRAALSAQGGDA